MKSKKKYIVFASLVLALSAAVYILSLIHI